MPRTLTRGRVCTAAAVTAAITASTASTAASATPTVLDPPLSVSSGTPVIFDTTAHPAFGWAMPERYDASWAAYSTRSGSYDPGFVTPRVWPVQLNACSSTAVHAITGYVYEISRVDGAPWRRNTTTRRCSTTSAMPALGTYDIRLSLKTDWGTADGVSEEIRTRVTLKDSLIVSMGDSLASGEGNPDERGDYYSPGADKTAKWKDRRCHRSALERTR